MKKPPPIARALAELRQRLDAASKGIELAIRRIDRVQKMFGSVKRRRHDIARGLYAFALADGGWHSIHTILPLYSCQQVATSTLRTAIQAGRVERRGRRGSYEYRLREHGQ